MRMRRKKNLFGCCKHNSKNHFIPILFQIHSLLLQFQQKWFILKQMIFNITSALDRTSCSDYVEFGKNADRFRRISWSQIEKGNQKYLDIQLKLFRKDDKGGFRRHQQIKLGVFDFKQPLCLRHPIVLAVREFSTDEMLKEVVTSPLSKEQLKHVQKPITIVDRPKRKIFATMKKYCMDKPESTYVQLRLFTRNSEHDKFQQLIFINYKYDEF